MDPSGAMSFPFCFTKWSARKEGVDADWDILVLLLHWYRMDLGRNLKWLTLHLLLSRPVDEGRSAASHAGRTRMYSHRRRGRKAAARRWRERGKVGSGGRGGERERSR
jgi:hypothetical protein